MHWIGIAGVLAMLGGGAVIAGHARHLAAAVGRAPDAARVEAAYAFQAVAPGARIEVPAAAGVSVQDRTIVLTGMEAQDPVRIDLCEQVLDERSGRMLPLRIGYPFDEVARDTRKLVRNVVLGSLDEALPKVDVTGIPRSGQLEVRWHGGPAGLTWISDAGAAPASFEREGWLAWPDGALRLRRRHAPGCAGAGELEVQWWRKDRLHAPGRAFVSALAPGREPVAAFLDPGHYDVPAQPRPGLEDQALFQQLQALHLVRLAESGMAELAPRDLAAWSRAGTSERADDLKAWNDVRIDADAERALRRLYRMADGAFVRQQVAIFNAERRLLAVRVKGAAGEWQASVGGAAAGTAASLPPAAGALFTDLPFGWGGWTRVAQWPETDGDPRAALQLAPAPRGRFEVMVAGHVEQVSGARVVARVDACGGRACRARDDVSVLTLEPAPGAPAVVLEASPLSLAAMASPGDERYRYLRVVDGRLAWKPVEAGPAPAPAGDARGERLTDRNGTLLWNAGAPTPEAVRAGLAPLLGVNADQTSGIAGMLARLGGARHEARLAIDLPLQVLAQQVLDCIGLHRGRWEQGKCADPQPIPRGRRAGLVLVDTETGDILAEAGGGAGDPYATSWNELRDFDRANPGASPLRLPAFQHDGGVHNSPGSTFKVVSALGLELAAQRDPHVEAMLSGMPLASLNAFAQERGFSFRTDAATYPLDPHRAHVTNFRDQHLDRRAQDGRFGLAQAITYSLNTWFAWSGELSDATLLGRPDGGMPMLQALDPHALGLVRPIAGMARLLGFGQPFRLDGGLLPADFPWSRWDALQTSAAQIDPIRSRHELRQMAIGLRMQATPLQMALVAGAVGQGRVIAPRLLLGLDGQTASVPSTPRLAVRLDRIRAGMQGVVDHGTAAGAFRAPILAPVRARLAGKTGTSPTVALEPDGTRHDVATVWFSGWLEPGALPGQQHRLAVAAFASHSDATGGEHAAPMAAALFASLLQNAEQKAKAPLSARLGG
ncbi:MAG: penicillin-binding transpeptidase domain-containing protein [Telluria sp.]